MVRRALPLLIFAAALAGCSSRDEEAPVTVAFIADPAELTEQGLRISPAAQQLRAATTEGLVALDENGAVVPAAAERWIVTDDGASYIFRLRDSRWPDGTRLTAPSVRDALQRTITQLSGTSLGLDLAQVKEVRAMAGRVIEFRLTAPSPDFLLLLAQPEMGLRRSVEGLGPMAVEEAPDGLSLVAVPPASRGLPQSDEWQEAFRPLSIVAMDAVAATQAFRDGGMDVVLGGRISTLPLADTGPLSRGTVRLDAGIGLFGLLVQNEEGVLAEASNREAIAMAIDRAALLEPFNIGGWADSTRIVTPGLSTETDASEERWFDLDIEARQDTARARIARWQASSGEAPSLRIELPDGPGSALLFDQLQEDLEAIGVGLVQVETGERADLALKDRIARYADAMWYLNQFNCLLVSGPCSEEADALVAQARVTADPAGRRALLAQAEGLLTDTNAFIPFGNPLRWSLVRGDIQGFAENGWAAHSLYALAKRPI